MYIANYPFFFQCYLRSRTDINYSLQLLDFFQESFLERGLNVSLNERFIFSGGFIFRWRRHPIGVDFALMGEGGGQKKSWSGRHPNHASPH